MYQAGEIVGHRELVHGGGGVEGRGLFGDFFVFFFLYFVFFIAIE